MHPNFAKILLVVGTFCSLTPSLAGKILVLQIDDGKLLSMTDLDSSRLDRIESLLEHLTTDVGKLTTDVEELKQEVTRTNDKVEIYQKASQQVVNLAFGLILTSALAIIIPAILNR